MIDLTAQPIDLPSLGQVATIQRVVAGSYGVPLHQLLSDRRDSVWPRHVAMYLTREMTPKSLPNIGRLFRRDHTTILYACRKVKAAIEADPLIRADVEALRERLAA